MDAPFDLAAALDALPLFPLAQAVLFPRALLPLHVFEPRYRRLLADCLATHRVMAIAMVPDPSDLVDRRGHPRLARVAGVGRIVECTRLADGRSDIVLEGLARVRLDRELPFEVPYRRAKATELPPVDGVVGRSDVAGLVAAATAFVSELRKRDAEVSLELPEGVAPRELVDLCAHHLVISPEVRQAVLEQLDPRARVSMVTAEIASQVAALRGPPTGLN